ncbi:MAG TPA: 30S ribosomal protein S5 [Bacillota bacterium]|nr:30S ribosomal protein S5 [Bacillota bacterium]
MTDKKKEFEALKKTAEAHKTLSEAVAEKKAKKDKKIAIKLTEEEIEKEKKKRLADAEKEKEIIEKADAEKEKKSEKELSIERAAAEVISAWEPKTKLGQEVKDGKIKSIDEIFDNNRKILEEQVVDSLLNLKTDLILIGQAKGKFGGGKRRVWRQTQKKTKEGNIPVFSTMAIVGDENGHIGVGIGKAKETLPARDKAIRKAKLNIMKVKRGCSSFDCACSELHTVPFKVDGKEGSCVVILIPAPQGTGLVVSDELKKMLKLAGIKDVYSKTFGKRTTTFNFVKACFNALKKTNLKNKK